MSQLSCWTLLRAPIYPLRKLLDRPPICPSDLTPAVPCTGEGQHSNFLVFGPELIMRHLDISNVGWGVLYLLRSDPVDRLDRGYATAPPRSAATLCKTAPD